MAPLGAHGRSKGCGAPGHPASGVGGLSLLELSKSPSEPPLELPLPEPPPSELPDSPLLEEEVASVSPLLPPPPLRFELPQLAATHAAVIRAAAMMIEPPMRMRLHGTSFCGAVDRPSLDEDAGAATAVDGGVTAERDGEGVAVVAGNALSATFAAPVCGILLPSIEVSPPPVMRVP